LTAAPCSLTFTVSSGFQMTRRKFLQTATAAATLEVLPSGATAQEPNERRSALNLTKSVDSAKRLPPVVFKTSEAVKPGGLLNLYGGDLESGQTVIQLEGDGRQLPILNSDGSSFVTTALPDDLLAGVYVLRVRNSAGWSAPVAINAAIPHWTSEETSFSGLPLRLFGRNLDAAEYGGKTHSELRLVDAAGKAFAMDLQEVTPYALGFTVPNLPLGAYSVEVRNALNTPWVRYHGNKVTIVEPSPDPLGLAVSWVRDFNWKNQREVTEYGAKGDGSTDDTRAIQRAIDDVADTGGGILIFPEGTYPFTSMGLRAGVVLQGDVHNPTLLHYVGTGGTAIQAVGDGLAQGRIGIDSLRFTLDATRLREDLKLMLFGSYNGGRDGATLSRIFIHHCFVDMPLDDPRIEQVLHTGTKGQVLIAGNHLRAARGDMWDTSVSSVIIRDNTFEYSKGFVETMASKAIVERNYIRGHFVSAVTGQTDFHGMFSTPATGKLLRHQYWADNVVEDINTDKTRNDGESFSTDAINGFMAGRVVSAEGKKLTLAVDCAATIDPYRITWEHEWQVIIVAGRGIGQIRAITGHAGDDVITIDRDWDVVPDATSKVSVTRLSEDVVAFNNTIRNNQLGMQLWKNGYDVVIADTRSRNTSGVNSFSAFVHKDHPYRPCSLKPIYFASFRRNLVMGVSSSWLGNQTVQIAVSAGDEVSKTAAYGVLSYGAEIKDNEVDHTASAGTAITVEGRILKQGTQVLGTLLEGNRIVGAKIGILISGSTVYYTTVREGVHTGVQQAVQVRDSKGTVVVNEKMLASRQTGGKQ
jgi:hypothetical protein